MMSVLVGSDAVLRAYRVDFSSTPFPLVSDEDCDGTYIADSEQPLGPNGSTTFQLAFSTTPHDPIIV